MIAWPEHNDDLISYCAEIFLDLGQEPSLHGLKQDHILTVGLIARIKMSCGRVASGITLHTWMSFCLILRTLSHQVRGTHFL